MVSTIIPASAAVVTCPANLSDLQCLDYLRQQSADLKKQGQQISEDLSNERYQQLSLSQQIEYMENKIKESEQQIAEMEVDLEAKNVEIKILTSEIEKTTEKIETVMQEKVKLENSINKSVSISYKYSFMGPVELLVKGSSFDTIFRKMKYLVESRKNDKVLLEQMKEKETILDQEEKVLAENQLSLETKRKEVEENKTSLFKENETLASQKVTYAALLQESKQKESELIAELKKNSSAQAAYDAAIIAYIQKNSGLMINSGPVPAGAIIGKMGSTGCSSSAHLHFTIEKTSQPLGYASISPWNYLKLGPDYWTSYDGWIYYYIRSGSMNVPLSGKVVITQDLHVGYDGGMDKAVDMYSLDGAGAFVLAAAAGTLYKGTEPICGGKYAKVVHPNGTETLYLHLQ